MTDSQLIQHLSQSLERQLHFYCQLNDLTQKILSRLILSRGDLTGIPQDFEKKQQFLAEIEKERQASHSITELWQQRKESIPKNESSMALDALLDKVQREIKRFLDNEGQLEKYLQMAMKE